MIHDPSPHRVSACPVHFLWDGRGHGRTFVRAGFLLVLVAGALFSLARMVPGPVLSTSSQVVLGLALASWVTGQVLSLVAARAFARGRHGAPR